MSLSVQLHRLSSKRRGNYPRFDLGINIPQPVRHCGGLVGRCPTLGLGYNLPPNTTDIGGEQKLWVLFRKTGHAGQTFEMIVRGNKFDIVFSGAGVDDGIGKGELVR